MPTSADSVRQLLGREAQLAVAEPLVDDLVAGRGRLLVLAGEPGIGKTRLAEEIAGRAQAAGATVAWGAAWPGDGAPPLWVWAQVLRQLSGSDAALDQQADGHVSPAASSAVRFAQLQAVADVVRGATAHGAHVLVLDDLQWADDASVRVLTFVAGALRDVPCLLIATYRSGELARDAEADLARVGVTLAVPPLAPDAAANLLRHAVGGEVAPAATEAIVVRSGGNPLFVWELGQLMAQTGRFDLAPAAVPSAIAMVIERRLARLSEDDVALLRVAAIGGDPVSATFVAAVAGLAVEDVARGLGAGVADGVLVETAPRVYSFAHALLRDVVVDGIDAGHRAELHRRAALAFATRADVDPAFHAVIADHLLRAGPEHARAASSHWELAARHALRVVAHREAATLFGRAVDSCGDDPARRAQLTVEQGEALLLAGDLVGARARFTEAAAEARATAQPELFARAVLGIGTGPIAWEVPLADTASAELVADALALLPEDATRLRSMVLARLSVTASTPQTADVALERAQAAVTLAEQVGDPALIGQALAALNDALGGPAHATTRRDNADAIVELAVAAGDRALELLGYRFRIVADLELGDIAAVDRDIAAFARLAEALRQPLASWYVPLFRGMRALLDGDVDRAALHHEAVAAAARDTGSMNASMLATTLEMGLDAARGRRPRPDVMEVMFEADPAEWATYAAGLAYAQLLLDDVVGATALLRLHSERGFSQLGDDSEHVTTLLMFGRVAIAGGELAAAAIVYERLLPFSGLWAVDGIAACCWGPVDLELGRLALALGRPGAAREHLASAGESVERAGAPLHALEIAALEATIDAVRPPGPVAGELFRRDGQFWTLTYRGRTARLKDAKGLHDLARLLAAPRRELHVLDLAGVAVRESVAGDDGGELLDARARADYRRRLAELEDDVADAEARADLGRLERARAERDFIAAELASALGLGGRPRRAGDSVERARKAVSGRIRMTIGRIADEHPELGRHLEASVRTGTFCVYLPELEVAWEL